MSRLSRIHAPVFALMVVSTLTLGVVSCHVRTIEVQPLVAGPTTSVTTPVKAHLVDGSTVTFPAGVSLQDGVIRGQGTRYGLALESLGFLTELSLDSVVGMESYVPGTNAGASLALSLLGTAAGVVVTAAAAVAIFGSCPTYYSDSAGTWQLEAEGFSYSIAELFEARDVDRLRVGTADDGSLRVEVRNEAFETHYINHLEMLDVRHHTHEMVLPDARDLPVAVGHQLAPISAVDRSGHDLRAVLASADGNTTRDDPTPAGLSQDDLEQHLDLVVPVPPGADSVALVFRLRNSLLNTVLLYDMMLGSQGLKALEWQSNEMREIGPALDVASWYTGNMGLRVYEVTGDSTRELGRLRDTGPIAWKDVAMVLPAAHAATMRLRLQYVSDNWRIDRITVAPVRRPEVHRLPLASALDRDGKSAPGVLPLLAEPDAEYLVTTPGQRFTAVWQPERLAAGESRTFLLASQGYYIEWTRREWLATARDTATFRPTRQVIADAMTLWGTARDSLERDFHNSRLPVR